MSLGLAQSAAHPGGNVTGTEINDDYYAKMVELLKATVPSLSRLAFLRNPTTPGTDVPMSIVQSAASQLGLEFVEFQARNFDEIDTAFANAVAMHVDGMVVGTDAVFTSGNDALTNLFPDSHGSRSVARAAIAAGTEYPIDCAADMLTTSSMSGGGVIDSRAGSAPCRMSAMYRAATEPLSPSMNA